jgi:hypothetical protein
MLTGPAPDRLTSRLDPLKAVDIPQYTVPAASFPGAHQGLGFRVQAPVAIDIYNIYIYNIYIYVYIYYIYTYLHPVIGLALLHICGGMLCVLCIHRRALVSLLRAT